jgi:hypothetical protein
MFTYVTGVFSTEGYRKDSPDVNNLFNVISSNSISMLENDGTPLKKGPIIGIDNLGNKKIMYPGGEYKFEGDEVLEIPMAQDAGEFRRLPAKYLKSHGKRIDDEYQMEGFEKAVNQDLDSLLKGWKTDGYDSHWYDAEAGEKYGVTSDQLRTFAGDYPPESFVNAAAYSHAMNKLANDAGGKNVINIPFADNPIFMRTADDDIEYVEYKKPTTLQEDGYIDETGTNAVNQDQSYSTGLAKRYTLYGGDNKKVYRRAYQEGGEELPKAQNGIGDGLKRFFRKNNIQTSLGFGNTAPHLNNYVPKVGINTTIGKPRKGFLDLGLTAGGDKKGFAGNLDATYYGPFMHGNRHFQGLIDSDTYYDQGTVGQSISGGGNWIGGSSNIGNKRKDGLRKGAWSTEGGIGLQIGAYKDLNAAPTSYYETQTTGGAPVLKYKPAPMGIDFGPKAHFRFQKAFGNNLTLDAKASIVADLVKNAGEGAAEGNQAQYAYEYIDNPDAPNYTNANQQIQSGNSILANEAVEDRFRPEFKPSAEVKLTYNIPTSGSLFGGRKRSKTPDELDEEISVRERKPKPEKEPKPKKEPKPVEVDEWARHPRWLKYGGEELDLGNINPNSRYGKWLTEKVSSGKYTYDSKLNKLMPKAQPGIETKTNSLDPLDIKSRISNMIEGKTQEQAASEAEAARIKEAAEAERAKLKEATEAKLFKPEVKPEDPDKTSIGYYGDTFYLEDNRKINAASGEPIVPTRDLFGGRYSRDVAEDIIKTSKNAKQDPYTMLAIALQETLLGKNDNNLGHIKDPMSDSMPEDYIYFFQNKQDELRNNEDFDYDNLSELLKIQAYNGLGTVYPHTEEDYHGHAMDYIYGVPLTGEGINMKENPLYGKRIIDLRDNVLKNNEAIKFLVDKYYNEDGGETDLYKVYSDFINGVYDDTNDYIRAEGIYDKLNRVHYKEAKESGMSIPNYIMTNVIKS